MLHPTKTGAKEIYRRDISRRHIDFLAVFLFLFSRCRTNRVGNPSGGGVDCLYHPCVMRLPQLEEPRQPDTFRPPQPSTALHHRRKQLQKETRGRFSRRSPLMLGERSVALPDDSCKQKNSPKPNLRRRKRAQGRRKTITDAAETLGARGACMHHASFRGAHSRPMLIAPGDLKLQIIVRYRTPMVVSSRMSARYRLPHKSIYRISLSPLHGGYQTSNTVSTRHKCQETAGLGAVNHTLRSSHTKTSI